jgi:hypothetical protein
MDKSVEYIEADTNMLEVKKLLHCLVTNGYNFERIREAVEEDVDSIYIYPNDAIADFSKDLYYHDTDGNYINDSKIKVSIHFEKRADYKNFKKNVDEDNVDEYNVDEDNVDEYNEYNGDPETFIKDLIEEIKLSKDLVKNGGGKKSCKNRGKKSCKNRGKKRKTKKNFK